MQPFDAFGADDLIKTAGLTQCRPRNPA